MLHYSTELHLARKYPARDAQSAKIRGGCRCG